MSDTKKLDPRTIKRREAIIEAARELFCEHGMAGTTLEMIIDEAGGSRRTIYELFGNKDGVFEAVIRDCTSRVTSMMAQLKLSSLPLEEALLEFGNNMMNFLTSHDTIRYLRLFLSEVPRFPHLGKVFYESGLMTGRRYLTEYFEREMKAGNFPEGDPYQAAIFFVSLLKSDYDIRQMTFVGWEPQVRDISAHVQAAVNMFLCGYGLRPVERFTPAHTRTAASASKVGSSHAPEDIYGK